MESPLDRHFEFIDQIRRAALSVPANVAEGYALGTKPQLIRHLRIALGSAAELRTHVDVASKLVLIDAAKNKSVIAGCDRSIGLIVGLLRRLGARVP